MQWLAVDEADLILSYGYEEDIHKITKLVYISNIVIVHLASKDIYRSYTRDV